MQRLTASIVASSSLCVLALAGGASAQTVTGNMQPTAGGQIVVDVTGLRSSRGSVRCILHGGPRDFPRGDTDIIRRVRVVPQGNSAHCVFEGLPTDHEFAVVIHHDENDDGRFAQGLFGIPQEGYGFSNNVRPVLHAPSFGDCRIRLASAPLRLRIGMLY